MGEMSLREIIASFEVESTPEALGEPHEEEVEEEGLEALDPETYLEKTVLGEAVEEEVGEEIAEATETDETGEEEGLEREEGIEQAEQVEQVEERARVEATDPPEAIPQVEHAQGGALESTRVWALMARLRAERASGVLVVTREGRERRIALADGEPTMAVSSAREDRLIELLYREGRLSQRQYEQASMTIGATGRRAGAVLVEKGLISSRELFPLVRHHYEMLIFDTFTWREGTWRFEEDADLGKERILLDISAAAIVVEGMRSRVPREEIAALISTESRPVLLECGICPLEEAGLSSSESEYLEWLDGGRTLADLADRFSLPEEEMAALLAALKVLGWVAADGAGEGPGEERAEAGIDARGSLRQELRVERARVADKLAQVADGSYFVLLEVPPEASGYEIRKAYRRLRGLFSTDRFAAGELLDLQEDVKDIRFVLDEAYEILRNPALREAYRGAL